MPGKKSKRKVAKKVTSVVSIFALFPVNRQNDNLIDDDVHNHYINYIV